MTDGLLIGLLLPFAGTTAGAACVFLLRKSMPTIVQKALLGFASGVMVAASVWSLLIPSIELCSDEGTKAVIPATIGFLAGIGFPSSSRPHHSSPASRQQKAGRTTQQIVSYQYAHTSCYIT